MENNELIKKLKISFQEIKKLRESLFKDNKIDLSDNNLYLGIHVVSKIYGLSLMMDKEFIEENNLESLIKKIDVANVKIQAAHYDDKQIFAEFLFEIYDQLDYRLQQIFYKYSLSEEERSKLIISKNYYIHLTSIAKDLLNKQTTDESNKILKEIISVINLYQVINHNQRVALGSIVKVKDLITEEELSFKIVLPFEENINEKKISLSKMKSLINHKPFDRLELILPSVTSVLITSITN